MMKFSIIFLIFFLFTSCTTPTPKKAPNWYTNIQIKEKNIIIGYGEGKTLKEAKSRAKEDIAQTVLTTINSSFTEKTVQENDNLESKIETLLQANTKLNLYNVRRLKEEQKGGIFYLALKYVNLNLTYRVKKNIKDFECLDDIENYLHTTPLIKKLSSDLECKLDFKLQRLNKVWNLSYKQYLFPLNEYEFEKLFVTKKSSLFNFKISKSPLIDGEEFYLTFKTKKRGYITLLNIYENGIVTLLRKSQKIEKDLQIPSKKSKEVFEAGLVDKNRDSYELFVAILSEKPLDMSRFFYADESLASSQRDYKFDELLDILENYEYSTLFVATKLKKWRE